MNRSRDVEYVIRYYIDKEVEAYIGDTPWAIDIFYKKEEDLSMYIPDCLLDMYCKYFDRCYLFL